MAELTTLLGGFLMLGGAFFVLSGAVGILRFPDFFSRLHPAGVKDALGAPMLLTGLMLISGWNLTTLKLVMLIAFMMITSPTATHALAQAALAQQSKIAKKKKQKPSRRNA